MSAPLIASVIPPGSPTRRGYGMPGRARRPLPCRWPARQEPSGPARCGLRGRPDRSLGRVADGVGHLGAWGGVLLCGQVFSVATPLGWILLITIPGVLLPGVLVGIFGVRLRRRALEQLSRWSPGQTLATGSFRTSVRSSLPIQPPPASGHARRQDPGRRYRCDINDLRRQLRKTSVSRRNFREPGASPFLTFGSRSPSFVCPQTMTSDPLSRDRNGATFAQLHPEVRHTCGRKQNSGHARRDGRPRAAPLRIVTRYSRSVSLPDIIV